MSRSLVRRLGASRHGPLLAALALACSGKPADTPKALGTDYELPLAPKQLSVELGVRGTATPFEPVMEVLSQELAHSTAALSRLKPAPYFVGYQVVERKVVRLLASDGSLVDETHDDSRLLDVDLRLGSPERDSTHRIPGEPNEAYKFNEALPLDYGADAMRNAIWLATDREYDSSLARWLRVEALEEPEGESDGRPDFTLEAATTYAEPPLHTEFDEKAWSERVKRLSAVALAYPEIQRSGITLSVSTETRYLANSEGSRLQLSRRSVRIELQAQAIAADGMLLDRFDSVDTRGLEEVPSDDVLIQRFQQMFLDLRALTKAEVIEPYVGPAILDGRAAGVFFHEVFGHRIEGHRQDAENEGQTFASMVGQPIMHDSISIYDDPKISRLNGIDLNGFYLFDDEGVEGQRAALVEDGVLRGFLLSRAPARGFRQSNGHGRREPGHAVVARQANLVVDPARTVSRENLERALLAEVKAQKLPYGLRFAEISGGFTQTQRYDTQAFKVIPVMVYRVYPGGRQELVRGVDIEGTPLTALSKITLASNDFQVFNGVCGAESGWVPVSATSPSLLLQQIEVARQEQGDAKAPILTPPPSNSASPGAP
jgi:TldD protein